ncbi:hypothetical protein VTL71DRAFT_10990 [Oculimacula yallundae]|uniref:Uncharacterized protein n=1 Tax=Oculimacula yallundae TaxID=86028 RepID=A0ABR4CUU5_9HELO
MQHHPPACFSPSSHYYHPVSSGVLRLFHLKPLHDSSSSVLESRRSDQPHVENNVYSYERTISLAFLTASSRAYPAYLASCLKYSLRGISDILYVKFVVQHNQPQYEELKSQPNFWRRIHNEGRQEQGSYEKPRIVISFSPVVRLIQILLLHKYFLLHFTWHPFQAIVEFNSPTRPGADPVIKAFPKQIPVRFSGIHCRKIRRHPRIPPNPQFVFVRRTIDTWKN